MKNEIDIESPINSLYIIEDKLIVACGGGPGLKNKLILYQLQLGNIGDILIDNIIEKTPKFIERIPVKKYLVYVVIIKLFFILFHKIGNHLIKYIL